MSALWLRSQPLFLHTTLLAALLLPVHSVDDFPSAADERQLRQRKAMGQNGLTINNANANANANELSTMRSSSLVVKYVICGDRNELANDLEGAFLDYFNGRCSDVANENNYYGNYYGDQDIVLNSLVLEDWTGSDEECWQHRGLDDGNDWRRKALSGPGDVGQGNFRATKTKTRRLIRDEKHYSESDVEPHHIVHERLDKSNSRTKKRGLKSRKRKLSSKGHYWGGPKYKRTRHRRHKYPYHPPVYPDPYLPHHPYRPPPGPPPYWYNPSDPYWNQWYYPPPPPPPGPYYPPAPPPGPWFSGGLRRSILADDYEDRLDDISNDPALVSCLRSAGFTDVYFARITEIIQKPTET